MEAIIKTNKKEIIIQEILSIEPIVGYIKIRTALPENQVAEILNRQKGVVIPNKESFSIMYGRHTVLYFPVSYAKSIELVY